MADAIRNILGDQESVLDYATVSLKESFAGLFCCWQAAIERTGEGLEHVHQLRVSSRRARAALELFAEFLPSRKTERLLAKLDNVRKSAGPARDGDVLAEKLEKNVLNDRVKQLLAEHLCKLRSDAQDTLVAYYEKCERGEQLEQQVTDLLGSLRPRRPRRHRGDATVDPFNDWARRQLRLASREFLADADVDTKNLECLHQFRIRAKQFRYCFELLQSALPDEPFKTAHSDLKKLSQRLGEINDHATAVETLSSLLNGDFSKTVHRDLRHWRKDERRALRHSIAEFAEWWTNRRQRRMRRRLKHAARGDRNISVAD